MVYYEGCKSGIAKWKGRMELGVKRRGAELPGLSGCTCPPAPQLTNWEFSEPLDMAMIG